MICQRSLEIFASWEKEHGDNIEWLKGGYAFPVYRKNDEKMLKKLLPVQKKHRLNIDFLGPEEIQQVIPGINPRKLRGGTFSPDDGSISPLLTVNAFYRRAVDLGVAFHFKERVRNIQIKNGRVVGVKTDQTRYSAPVVVDAAGPFSTELGRTVGIEISVVPDSHERFDGQDEQDLKETVPDGVSEGVYGEDDDQNQYGKQPFDGIAGKFSAGHRRLLVGLYLEYGDCISRELRAGAAEISLVCFY